MSNEHTTFSQIRQQHLDSLNISDFLSAEEIELRKRLLNDFPYYSYNCLKIRQKEGGIIPFVLNREQGDLHLRLQKQLDERGMVRAIILKGRQQGMSTYVQARFFWKVSQLPGRYAFILTHESAASENIFAITNRYYLNCPQYLKPDVDKSNPQEMLFGELDSGYAVGTSGNKDVGRSRTIQYLHGSEVAFWKNADLHTKGIMQAVPRLPGTEIILESTANGIGNYFHTQWELATTGQSDFEAIFYPWFWHTEYIAEVREDFQPTNEEAELVELYGMSYAQLAWRRIKIAELAGSGRDGVKAFTQEYPNNPVEAFHASSDDFLIRTEWVMEARKRVEIEAVGPLIVGVDPARFGKDATAIIRRKGRHVYNLQYFHKLDTMNVTGKLKQILDEEKPRAMFIDVSGLGAGVVDRLRELGYEETVRAINFGESALNDERYFNRRSEMWGLMSLWFQNKPCKIPDVDSLHSDLVNLACVPDSRNRLKLEPKETASKRIGRSPDGGDALALTFAMPVDDSVGNKDTIVNELLKYQNQSQSFWGAV